MEPKVILHLPPLDPDGAGDDTALGQPATPSTFLFEPEDQVPGQDTEPSTIPGDLGDLSDLGDLAADPLLDEPEQLPIEPTLTAGTHWLGRTRALAAPEEPEQTEPTDEPEQPEDAAPSRTSRSAAFAWRTGSVYALLYCLPFPLDLFPPTMSAATSWANGKRDVVAWLASRWFGVELTVFPNGSGDTTYNYFEVLFYAVAALLIGSLWQLGRRAHRPGPRARDMMRTWVRYWLAVFMLGYGAVKALPLQFGQLDAEQLSATWGQSSPVNVLWTFMAASPIYTSFVGFLELAAGLLLLSRSTTLLGGLVTIAVMANVAMVDFCYDVPAKLLSLHLLLFAALLCARDAGRLFDMFVRNRAIGPAELWPWWRSQWLRRPIKAVKLLFVAWLLFTNVRNDFEAWQAQNEPPPPLSGVWAVETFVQDGAKVPPFTSPGRWLRLGLDRSGRALLVKTDGSRASYAHAIDAAKGTLQLSGLAGPQTQAPAPVALRYSSPDPAHLVLEGSFEGAALRVECRRIEPANFPMVQRGFHWINDSPSNHR